MDDKIIWISPDEIKWCSRIYFTDKKIIKKMRRRGIVKGNWDEPIGLFEDISLFYKAFQERLARKNWQETDFYKIMLRRKKWTEEKLNYKLQCWENIYFDMKENGYKIIPKERVYDEFITIDIGRDGHIFFHNGIHRLTFAKTLKIPKIPVKIMLRHKQWQQFRKQILKYASRREGKVYTYIDHPDLWDMPCVYGKERVDTIVSAISPDSKTILDIGAHWGAVSFAVESTGRQITAVEKEEKALFFLNKLKIAKQSNIRIISENIFNFIERENKFDTVIALNIFHHFLKREETFKQLILLLNRLQMKEMFFQAHTGTEEKICRGYRNFMPIDFVSFIIENSCLRTYKEIGEFNERKLYHLTI